MQTFPTLYKRTSAGKVQIWFAEVDGDRYRTTSEGSLFISSHPYCCL